MDKLYIVRLEPYDIYIYMIYYIVLRKKKNLSCNFMITSLPLYNVMLHTSHPSFSSIIPPPKPLLLLYYLLLRNSEQKAIFKCILGYLINK